LKLFNYSSRVICGLYFQFGVYAIELWSVSGTFPLIYSRQPCSFYMRISATKEPNLLSKLDNFDSIEYFFASETTKATTSAR